MAPAVVTKQGLVARVHSVPGDSNCSATPLAAQWMLTAAHCLFNPSRKLLRDTIQINDGLGIQGVWDGVGSVVPPGTSWVAVAHPTRDLALLHRWPILNSLALPGLPSLPEDPLISAYPMALGDRFDSVLGFGCTTGSNPNDPGLQQTAHEGAMVVSGLPVATQGFPGSDKFPSWAVEVSADPQQIAGGDSGGPARTDREVPIYLLGDGATTQRRFVTGINFAVTYLKAPATPVAAKCPWKAGNVVVNKGYVTTFDVESAPGGGVYLGPAPIEWINSTRTDFAKRGAKLSSSPKTSLILPSSLYPPNDPNAGLYPDVAWLDLDGDGQHDLYSWGANGLQAIKNTANATLGEQQTLLASLPAPLLGIPPFVGDFSGDSAPDVFVLGGTPELSGFSLYTGIAPLGANKFEPELAIAEPGYFAPFFLAAQQVGVAPPYAAAVRHPVGESSGAVLFDAKGPGGAPLPVNGLLFNAGGLPTLVGIPRLRAGVAEADRNFVFDDVDGDGRLNLVVAAAADALTGEPAITTIYSFDNDEANGGAATLKPLALTGGAPFALPIACPMPINRLRFVDVTGDNRPDFLCLRPGTIDV